MPNLEKRMSHSLEIFTASVCPFAQRCIILLEEKGLTYTKTEIDLANKPKDFAKISPYGKVPVLRQDEYYIYESLIINEYLDEVFPEKKLLAENAYLRAQMRIWTTFVQTEFVPVHYKLLMSQEPELYPELREQLSNVFYQIEQALAQCGGQGPFWFGDKISLTDINNYPFFERFVTNEYYRQAKIPEDCTRVKRWIEAMRQHPSVQVTSNPPEFYIERYKRYADGTRVVAIK